MAGCLPLPRKMLLAFHLKGKCSGNQLGARCLWEVPLQTHLPVTRHGSHELRGIRKTKLDCRLLPHGRAPTAPPAWLFAHSVVWGNRESSSSHQTVLLFACCSAVSYLRSTKKSAAVICGVISFASLRHLSLPSLSWLQQLIPRPRWLFTAVLATF